MFASCLFDNVEVAKLCVEKGWLFETATICVALQQGGTKVASFLYDTAVKRGYEDILGKCDFVITNSFSTKEQRIKGSLWLIEKGYIFKFHELLGLICNDELDLFKLTFRDDFKRHYATEKVIEKCLLYKAYNILDFLQTKLRLPVLNDSYEKWRKEKNVGVAVEA
jgi:hypothetical protein